MKYVGKQIRNSIFAAGIGLAIPYLASADPLRIRSHAAGDAGFRVTSHLIYGAKEGVLVDAQFTRSEARQVAAIIKDAGISLKSVIITHAHPDHYFGLEQLRKDFPYARFLASAATVKDINDTGAAKLAQWKPLYGDDLTDTVPVVEVLKAKVTVDGRELQLLDLDGGESEHASAVIIPSLKTVIAGDALFDQVHFWLAEGRLDGVKANLKALKELPEITYFLAGHALASTSQDSGLVDRNRDYVDLVERSLGAAGSAGVLLDSITKAYPQYALPVIAKISAEALLP